MDKILNDRQLALIFHWHSQTLGLHMYQALTVYCLFFQPLLVNFGESVPEMSSASYTEGIEIFFFNVMRALRRGYAGPAPPYYLIKKNKPFSPMTMKDVIQEKFESRYRKNTAVSGSNTVAACFEKRFIDRETHEFVPNRNKKYGYYTPPSPSKLLN